MWDLENWWSVYGIFNFVWAIRFCKDFTVGGTHYELQISNLNQFGKKILHKQSKYLIQQFDQFFVRMLGVYKNISNLAVPLYRGYSDYLKYIWEKSYQPTSFWSICLFLLGKSDRQWEKCRYSVQKIWISKVWIRKAFDGQF